MALLNSISKRRIGVAINYLFLLLSLLFCAQGYWQDWPIVIKISFWLSVFLVLATFFPVHIQTGLWRLAHSKAESLDEREMTQILESIRHSYIFYAVTSLIIILILVVFQLESQTEYLVIFWSLLYLAHTLPSSILAWTTAFSPIEVIE